MRSNNATSESLKSDDIFDQNAVKMMTYSKYQHLLRYRRHQNDTYVDTRTNKTFVAHYHIETIDDYKGFVIFVY